MTTVPDQYLIDRASREFDSVCRAENTKRVLPRTKFGVADWIQFCSQAFSEDQENNTYATDEYPRLGCVASVDVLANGYRLAIRDPSGRLIEGYAVLKSPAAISRMLREWCEGKRPMIKGEGD